VGSVCPLVLILLFGVDIDACWQNNTYFSDVLLIGARVLFCLIRFVAVGIY